MVCGWWWRGVKGVSGVTGTSAPGCGVCGVAAKVVGLVHRLAAAAVCWCGLLPGQLVWVWVRLGL